ncbi:hypothetical protein CPC08DRAFT_690469 [Agrocybe pediades]|nr:hypothetical protein CPC08DRAFT_690469 [Agrocybe pediades]
MESLNQDVLYQILDEVDACYNDKDRRAVLSHLSLVCRWVRHCTKPVLFANVRWPHPKKHDEESGLQFFPQELWGYFKYFHLDWPDHWPDATPPLWGTIHTGNYTPLHMDKLEVALPAMTNIHTFQITCPFHPPTTLFKALLGCANIKDLRMTDTPLNLDLFPKNPAPHFQLERFTFLPVAEALRVGEGPHDKKYHDLSYYTREYRKRHWSAELASQFTLWSFFLLMPSDSLKYLQISGRYYALSNLVYLPLPNLETLVLTGPEPEGHGDTTILSDAVRRMPKLRDLRVMISGNLQGVAPSVSQSFCLAPVGSTPRQPWEDVSPDLALAQIKHLAVSTLCNIDKIFECMRSLERLAVLAVINHPRIPLGLPGWRVRNMIENMISNKSGKYMRLFRVMIEDGLEYHLLERLYKACPKLEFIEIESCGYHEGDVGHYWTDYGAALENFQHLKFLRLGIPFEGCDERTQLDPAAFLRADRRDFGIYIASCVPSLTRIGFEYRMKPAGQSHYEDRWLDFDIERRLEDGRINLRELPLSWYPFPEVWEPVELRG